MERNFARSFGVYLFSAQQRKHSNIIKFPSQLLRNWMVRFYPRGGRNRNQPGEVFVGGIPEMILKISKRKLLAGFSYPCSMGHYDFQLQAEMLSSHQILETE